MNWSSKPYTHILFALVAYCTLVTLVYANADYERGKQLYQYGKGKPTDFPEALQAFTQASEDDHAKAQFDIGYMHQFGKGTAIDLEKAAYWYLRAGKNGQARAWNNLGMIYTSKDSPKYSPSEAIKCYKQASKMGIAVASNNLASVYHYGKHEIPKDFAKAKQFYLLTLKQAPNKPDTWNNLGRLYEQGGHGIERDLEAARHAYTKASQQKDSYGYCNLANLYDAGHFKEEPEVIIRLYTQAAKLGNAMAMGQLGWFYETGRYVTVDKEQALRYYEASAAKGYANAQNSLAMLLIKMNREAHNSPRVIELIASAAEQNNVHAISNYGERIIAGKVPGVPIEEGVKLLKKAATRGYPNSLKRLGELAHRADFQQYFTNEEAQHWTANSMATKEQARATATRIIESAQPAVDQGRYDEALTIITTEHQKYNTIDVYNFEMIRTYWEKVGTISGRTDPEWGWRFFTWLKSIYDRDYPNAADRILVAGNIVNSLTQCGRIAQSRQACQEAEALILSMNGLSITAPLDLQQATNYTFPASAYTTHYSAKMLAPILNHKGIETGDWIGRAPMEASLTCARDELVHAQWKQLFFITGQVEHWAREILASETFPGLTNRESMLSNLSKALLIKAEAYESLGLPKQALDCYSEIIDEDMRSYLGRDINKAITRRARLLTQLGHASEVDLEQLRETIRNRRDNKFENRDSYQFAQLALAHASYLQGNRAEAHVLLSQILESTTTSSYTFLRIEALRVQIGCALIDETIDGIESALIETIELARSKGLNNLEPTLYELYAQYLAQSGQLKAAQRIQQKAIDLLQRLQMQPRLGPAQVALKELRDNGSVQPTIDQHHFDLQPSRITSAPLPGQGSIAVFSLSNLENIEHDFQLSLNGQAISITIPQASASIEPELPPSNQLQLLEFHLLPANSDEGATSQTQGTLSSNEQRLIEIHAPASIFEDGDKQLSIQANIGSEEQQVELILLADAGAADITVIDAIELIDNPYYLVPAFHSIASMDDAQSVGLRAIASQPTRIEAYNTNNELLFIDAEGNGKFNDPGDLINSELAADLSPIIQIDTNTIQVEFRYQPHLNSGERVDVEVQTRQISDTPDWKTQVIDWIQQPKAHD